MISTNYIFWGNEENIDFFSMTRVRNIYYYYYYYFKNLKKKNLISWLSLYFENGYSCVADNESGSLSILINIIWDLILVLHHHNNCTTIPHIRVRLSVWVPPSCEELLYWCYKSNIFHIRMFDFCGIYWLFVSLFAIFFVISICSPMHWPCC